LNRPQRSWGQWGSRGREFESRHSDQKKVLDFFSKSSTFSFISYSESLGIRCGRVHFFKNAGTQRLECTQKGAVKMSTIPSKKKDEKAAAFKSLARIVKKINNISAQQHGKSCQAQNLEV